MLELYNKFELSTAQQLAFERGRDKPNGKDLNDAIKLAAKWNKRRIKLNMRPFQ